MRVGKLLLVVLVACSAFASSVKPIKGVDVIVQKKPGNVVNRQTKTDADGTFKFNDLEPGLYVMTVNPPMSCDKQQGVREPNALVRAIVENPGATTLAVAINGGSCFLSSEIPLRGSRAQNGFVSVTGSIPLEFATAGIRIEVEIESARPLSGQVWTKIGGDDEL